LIAHHWRIGFVAPRMLERKPFVTGHALVVDGGVTI